MEKWFKLYCDNTRRAEPQRFFVGAYKDKANAEESCNSLNKRYSFYFGEVKFFIQEGEITKEDAENFWGHISYLETDAKDELISTIKSHGNVPENYEDILSDKQDRFIE